MSNVLIIDDSSAIRSLIEFTLKNNYDTRTAESAEQALEILDSFTADIIITDINMSGMSGLELTRTLRKHSTFQYTPIIALTTEISDEAKKECKQAGMSDWLGKPLQPDKLLKVIHNHLD